MYLESCEPVSPLVFYYRCSIQSGPMYRISAQYGSCWAADRRALKRVINTAQKVIGCSPPSLEDLFSSRCLSRAVTLKGPSHPGHHLFDLLTSGRRFSSIISGTNRLKNGFYPGAIWELNIVKPWHWLFETYVTLCTTIQYTIFTLTEHCTDVYIPTTPLYVQYLFQLHCLYIGPLSQLFFLSFIFNSFVG